MRVRPALQDINGVDLFYGPVVDLEPGDSVTINWTAPTLELVIR